MTQTSEGVRTSGDYRGIGNLLHAPVAPLLQTNPWRFASGYFDSATGFTKFGVRYYDATVGRWTQQDPQAGNLFDARSSNRYVYAKCDPVNVTDPGGAGGWDCFWAGVDSFGVLVGLYLAIVGIASAILAPNPFSGLVAVLGVFVLLLSIRSVIPEIQACFSN